MVRPAPSEHGHGHELERDSTEHEHTNAADAWFFNFPGAGPRTGIQSRDKRQKKHGSEAGRKKKKKFFARR